MNKSNIHKSTKYLKLVTLSIVLLASNCAAELTNPADPGNEEFWLLLGLRCFLGECTDTATAITPQVQTLKTNLIQCWDATGGLIACAGTGQDGEYQIGLTRSFTGPTPHPTYATDYTTTDNTTGLVWESCAEGQTGSDCSGGAASDITWFTATSPTCQNLNALNAGSGYAGRTNWRLPLIEELSTLVDYAYADTKWAFDSPFPFTGTVLYWPNSDAGAGNAWYTNFNTGHVQFVGKATPLKVRCVSSSLWPTSSTFTDNGDGTVSDSATNLVWQKCSRGQSNYTTCADGSAVSTGWESALGYCNGLDLAGKTWRLPNINELKSIVYFTTTSRRIDTNVFPNSVASFYWSSSTNITALTTAWNIDFDSAKIDKQNKSAFSYNVRCVSSMQ